MKTLIELLDEQAVFNIYAPEVFRPETVVFIGSFNRAARSQYTISNYFHTRGINSKIEFAVPDEYTSDGIMKCLEKICTEHEDCAIDLTGGDDFMLFTVGRFSMTDNNIRAFSYNKSLRSFIDVCGCPSVGDTQQEISLNIADFIHMVGGEVVGHGHFGNVNFDEFSDKDIDAIWKVFLKFRHSWKSLVSYFQNFKTNIYDTTAFRAPLSFLRENGKLISCNIGILKALQSIGFISNVKMHGNSVDFRFRNKYIFEMLCDMGIWLELHTYRKALQCNYFDDAAQSVVIDWNGSQFEGGDVTNEIDVIVTKGIIPMFISCKSGIVNTEALNEIHTLTQTFGGAYAKPVLVTCMSLPEQSASIYKRAIEMGINVIDYDDLITDRLEDMLINIIER